jgi:hypothetical protein
MGCGHLFHNPFLFKLICPEMVQDILVITTGLEKGARRKARQVSGTLYR